MTIEWGLPFLELVITRFLPKERECILVLVERMDHLKYYIYHILVRALRSMCKQLLELIARRTVAVYEPLLSP
jgi:hypothetical protein